MPSAAPLVIGIPGTLCDPRVFAPLAELLPDVRFDAVSWMTETGPWDIETVASRVASRITAGGADRAVIVGHSTGGAIAQQLGLAHPDVVAGLVLVDTGANMHHHGDVEAILETIRTNWSPALAESILDRSFARPLLEADRRAFLEYAASVERQAALDVLSSQHVLDFAPRLAVFGGVPVEVVHGRLDPVRTVAQAEAFARGIGPSGARLTVVESGHTPVFEAPRAVAAVVRRVLDASRS